MPRKTPATRRGRRRAILVTGFERFGDETFNPSAEIARALHGETIGGRTVVGAVLPCVFRTSLPTLRRLLREIGPEIVICIGLAAGRAEITPERVAINVDDARIPDNAGRRPVDVPVVAPGPAAYWSTLPIKAIVQALRRKQIPAAVSQSAGTFVCNHTFYGLMHLLRRSRSVRAGFIHVPYALEQMRPPGAPGIPLPVMVDAIRIAIRISATVRRDIRGAEGAAP